ncbi:hypothetical protein HUJ04_005725 [Dendroctonus ponderosae]|uniref:F-box domain-containing protein n=1 Tax=Dendroctonus ponderosae TaxID=77166 RepID=J3JWR2_DENPD
MVGRSINAMVDNCNGTSMDALPDEVIEFILSFVSTYKDLHNCMAVSERWKRCAENVRQVKNRKFHKSIADMDMNWTRVSVAPNTAGITRRFSHSAVVCDDLMYIFGGCTSSMTTFNDLWKLDLNTRMWIRPITTGAYPSPKACSTLVQYKEMLILFGGWTYPPSYPLHQSWHLYDELHVYDKSKNQWTCINTMLTPPPMAGHSASVVGDWMIVFGGLQRQQGEVHCEKSNVVWKLNLVTWTWTQQLFEGGQRPKGRFGATQVVLDEKNLLILGGSAGPNIQFHDCWILNMEGDAWKWIRVSLLDRDNEAQNIWSNPGCLVGDKLVVLNKRRNNKEAHSVVYYPRSQWLTALPEHPRFSRIDLANRPNDVDDNVNGRRGSLLNRHQEKCSQATQQRNIQHTVELSPMAKKRLIAMPKSNELSMTVCVLDIAQVLTAGTAKWLMPKTLSSNGPEETILYSLVQGQSELIMFGGILKDCKTLFPCDLSNQISNCLQFITAHDYVI